MEKIEALPHPTNMDVLLPLSNHLAYFTKT